MTDSHNPFSLENKTILVTGASSGIGKAASILCAQLGAKLILTGRNTERLEDVLMQLKGNGHSKVLIDFEETNAIETLINSVNKIDGIVHSAGILETIPVKFTSPARLNKIMKINFEIPFQITVAALKNKKINTGSSLVFISSLSGVSTVAKGIAAYSASKGAISASIRVMALELAPQKIRVNAVCPGMVVTSMNTENDNLTEEQLKEDEKRNYPLGYGKPEDVANAAAFLLSDASSWITGTNLIIDGGASIH